MRGTLYKALGFLVWKGFLADMRRRGRAAARLAGAAALIAMGAAVVLGVALAVRRRSAARGQAQA